MSEDPSGQTSVSLDAVASYYKRKYENECAESLKLIAALQDAVRKNADLVQMAQILEQQLNGPPKNIAEPELPLDGEIIPPVNGHAKKGKGHEPA